MLTAEQLLYKILSPLPDQKPLVPNMTVPGVIKDPIIRGPYDKLDKNKEPLGIKQFTVNIPVAVDSEIATQITGIQSPQFQKSFWVDLNQDEDDLDYDSNHDLGVFLADWDMNDGTHALHELEGRSCLATIGTQLNKKDGRTYNVITRIIPPNQGT